MSKNSKSGTLMVHLDLIRDGFTYQVGGVPPDIVVDKDFDASILLIGDAKWQPLGDITTFTETPVIGNVINVMRPKANGGTLEVSKKIHLGPVERTFVLTATDYNDFTLELAAMAGEIPDTEDEGELEAYVPFSGDTDPVRGWFQLRWYDHDDKLQRREVVWGELRLAAALAAGMTGNAIQPQFNLNVFPNPHNKGWRLKETNS